MDQNINQVTNSSKTILPKNSLSIDFDKDFYGQLDQKNFYKKNSKTKKMKNTLKNELSIIKKGGKVRQITSKLKKFPSFMLGQIIDFANFLATIPPFKNILEISSFLTKSRNF